MLSKGKLVGMMKCYGGIQNIQCYATGRNICFNDRKVLFTLDDHRSRRSKTDLYYIQPDA